MSTPSDWSPDGGVIAFSPDVPDGVAIPVWTLVIASGESTAALAHPEKSLFQAHFAPDGRWITFNATSGAGQTRSEVFIAPYRKGRQTPESEWIAVTDGWGWDDKPRWSPDGNIVYFTSDRDGFRCIWMQRLDPQAKRPVGDPTALYHFHSARRSPMNLGLGGLEMSVTRDKIVLNLGEQTGNIWLAELEERY